MCRMTDQLALGNTALCMLCGIADNADMVHAQPVKHAYQLYDPFTQLMLKHTPVDAELL